MDVEVRYHLEDLRDQAMLAIRSDFQEFPSVVERWVYMLDNAPEPIQRIVDGILPLSHYDEVERDFLNEQNGTGNGTIRWPLEKESRLSAQQHLFREMASGNLDSTDFAFHYFSVSHGDLNDANAEMVSRLFEPHATELHNYVARRIEGVAIPASDRIVTIDDNAPLVQNVFEALTEIEDGIRQSNSLEPDEKVRLEAEVKAGREVLKGGSARVDAIRSVLLPPLKYISKKLADSAIGVVARNAFEWVITLIGA